MLLEEFDMDEYIKMERRDSYADGHEDGLSLIHILAIPPNTLLPCSSMPVTSILDFYFCFYQFLQICFQKWFLII